MRYSVDTESTVPAYLQLYKLLRDDIINGVYSEGAKLPSKRTTAAETGVSTITVEHSYALLCDEGYIESRERSGFFVTFRKSNGFAASKEMRTEQAPVHNTIHTYPDFPLSVLKRTMRKVLSDYSGVVMQKSPNAGCDQLREAIKLYLKRNRGINVEINQIIIGSGAEYLYGLLIELLGRNKIYGIESPSYEKIEQVYSAADVKYELLPLSSNGISSKALSKTDADVLHTTPYRSFPTGITATASKRHEYIFWAGKGGRYIIEDDFESEFSVSSKPVDTLFALSEHDNVIYLNTFSKTISPALRAGYMVLPISLAKKYEKTLGFYSCTVPTFEQFVLAELINNGDFERHINRVRRAIRKREETKTPH